MGGANWTHFNNFTIQKLNPVVFGQDSGLRHAVVLGYRYFSTDWLSCVHD
jgi:hypothetical protein